MNSSIETRARDLPPDLLVQMYFDMLRIRMVEEEIAGRYPENEMRCPVHLSVGQEATAVGACHALSANDKIFSTHRSHAHYLAKGGDLKKMLAEIYGKKTGCIGGRGGSMHLTDPEKGMMLSVPIVSSSIPLATGSALADKRLGKNDVTVAFIGDASVEEGVFHESANFAALRKLPVIYFCEHNLYSVYTHIDARQPKRPITALAEAHGIPTVDGDGNDIADVYKKTVEAVKHARSGNGPMFLLFTTYRWREHCGPNYDNHLGYRTESEFEEWRERDPIVLLHRFLVDHKLLDSKVEAEKTKNLSDSISEAFEFAKSSPLPDPSDASSFVYA